MEILKVSKQNYDKSLPLAVAKIMMKQMTAISTPITEEKLLHTVTLALDNASGAELFIANENGEIVGYAFLNSGISLEKGGFYIWLNDLYVVKQHRRKGVARKLLLKVLYWAEQEGYRGIELETGINNIATKKLYNALGFYDIVSKRYGRHI
ncbi:GNAT family N-acetyltransferase [Evansella cellulosilytica]|uniref:GCN5-related N-acetyltransferase n=1 Tax=Evansella cellulosilytica (strain ATCC 21833 / DSM 2522 / FERM P-1141 / JCM 9156 / N-4) TaxID=649639 RepID=E6TXY6_EVAC2|nr:GNAT family N-acetyltransferase [Evansella cellulosilytica]ADU31199.1 GCN5-related N-acetyltransferase [Evansella cellulosilytica DSM 2522]